LKLALDAAEDEAAVGPQRLQYHAHFTIPASVGRISAASSADP
jgi:hypothetical protein